jgi:hypothetical protein
MWVDDDGEEVRREPAQATTTKRREWKNDRPRESLGRSDG